MKIINKKDDVITFKYFLNNPIGQDAQAMHYNLIRQEYTRKYNELMKKKKIEIAGVYKINQSYFLHLLIPSESNLSAPHNSISLIKISAIHSSSSLLFGKF